MDFGDEITGRFPLHAMEPMRNASSRLPGPRPSDVINKVMSTGISAFTPHIEHAA